MTGGNVPTRKSDRLITKKRIAIAKRLAVKSGPTFTSK
jgi:hypothetical protein